MKAYVVAVVALLGCKEKSVEVTKSTSADHTEVLGRMNDLTAQMCACNDKACADKVQADMTAWSSEMAAASSKMGSESMRRMSLMGRAYGTCMTKAVAASSEPVATPAPKPSAIESGSEPRTREADGLIREAVEWAATNDPETRIRHLHVAFVDRSGLLDPKFGDIDVHFGRVSTEKRRVGTPSRSAEHYCYDVGLSYGRWVKTQNRCSDTIDYVPHCTVVAIWNRALERNSKVDADAVASIVFTPSNKTWTFAIDDEPTNLHVREELPDDCELKVER